MQSSENTKTLKAENSRLRMKAEINHGMRANDRSEHFTISEDAMAQKKSSSELGDISADTAT